MKSVFTVTIRDRATGYELTTEIRYIPIRVGFHCEYGSRLLTAPSGSVADDHEAAIRRIYERLDRLATLLDVRRRRTK